MTPSRLAGDRKIWTRESLIEKIRRWVELYGEPPRSADLNPSAAKWTGSEWRVDRYRAGDPETGEPWPSLNAIKAQFDGSLSKAIEAAGFSPNKPGPPSRREVAKPTLNEDRMVMSPAARVALEAARAEAREMAERLEVRERQIDSVREANTRLRQDLEASRSAKRLKVVTTKTKTNTVVKRVEDTRSLRKLERVYDRTKARLADAEALIRAERDRGKAALRDLSRIRMKAEELAERLEESEREFAVSERERKALEDRLTAAENKKERVEIREVEVLSVSDQEVADARIAMEEAEKEVHEANVRAARAEREMRELGALVKGENRRLTAEEIEELREGGPSGPAVLASALKDLAQARKLNPMKMREALTKLASAAIRWRDALDR